MGLNGGEVFGEEVGFLVVGVELSFFDGVGEIKSTGFSGAFVELLKAWDGVFDVVADEVVVVGEGLPLDGGVFAEEGVCDFGDNGGFAEEVFGNGVEVALGAVDDAHGVFDGDVLFALLGLEVFFTTYEAGKDEGLFASRSVRAVEFGGDLYGEVAVVEGFCGVLCVGGCGEEVASQGDEDLGVTFVHGLDGGDGIVAVFSGGGDLKFLIQCLEEAFGGLFPDAHGAVALDVAVSADGAEAGTGFPECAEEQVQVADLLDGGHGIGLLR